MNIERLDIKEPKHCPFRYKGRYYDSDDDGSNEEFCTVLSTDDKIICCCTDDRWIVGCPLMEKDYFVMFEGKL